MASEAYAAGEGCRGVSRADEVWAVIEAALSEPELYEVRVSELLRGEIEDDPESPLILLDGAPGRVLALLYYRPLDNVRLFGFDEAGRAWIASLGSDW